MAQMAIILTTTTRTPQYVTYSWTTGVIRKNPQRWVIRNDNDAQAYALHLIRQGKMTEAEDFLDHYCDL